MESRIHNKRKMKQLIDFKGCAVDGGMYPTDIDGVIEYKDSKYIIFEVKYGDSEIPIGQRLALQRMVDDFTKSGKQAIVLICSHTVKNPNKPVVMAWCNVREIYYGDEKRWRTPDKEIKVRVQKERSKETEENPGLAHRTVQCTTGQCPVHQGPYSLNSSPSGLSGPAPI